MAKCNVNVETAINRGKINYMNINDARCIVLIHEMPNREDREHSLYSRMQQHKYHNNDLA